LEQRNRPEEEIQTLDELLRRFGEASEPTIRSQVVTAFLYKGQILKELNRPQEARLCLQDVVTHFGDSAEGAIRELVEKAKSELRSVEESNR
jgi:hypothetical protein